MASMLRSGDHVDAMVAAWAHSAPDLEVEPLEVVGRVLRLAAVFSQEIDRTLDGLGLSYGDFDVISTLLREDEPEGMHPSRLARSALITTGAMTTRLDRLDRLGLITRAADETDRRAIRIQLTDAGRAHARTATDAVLEVDRRLLEPLSSAQRSTVAGLLRRLLLAVDAQ